MYNYKLKRPTIVELNTFLKAKVFDFEYFSWFQKISCPIFKFSDNSDLYKNPNLKNLEFYRVKDTFSAFQTIGQFLGGVLTNTETNESKLSDKHKILQYGFDLKYGFRTRPTKKRNANKR